MMETVCEPILTIAFKEWLSDQIKSTNILIDNFEDGSLEGHALANTARGRRGAFREILEMLNDPGIQLIE